LKLFRRLPTTPLGLSTTVLASWLLGACSTDPTEAPGPLRKETVVAVTAQAELIRFNAGQPQKVLARQALRGLPAGERLVGLDYRVARGVLYAVGSGGRLYTLDTATAQLTPVGTAAPVALSGQRFGVDFNPVADRVRLVSDSGQNLRLHPDTGALAATDPPLAYAPGDARFGQPPRVAAAGYTYNKANDKLTTNYAISLDGWLLTQGGHEQRTPPVSPNTGQLFTVGALGTGPVDDVSMDLSDLDNSALAALQQNGRTRLFVLDLASGRATALGTVADGGPLWGLAIEP
jgi:hypothetical protein